MTSRWVLAGLAMAGCGDVVPYPAPDPAEGSAAVVFALDWSGSMSVGIDGDANRAEAVRRSMRAIVEAGPATIGLVTFNSLVVDAVPPDAPRTELERALGIEIGGGTNYVEPLEAALDLLEGTSGLRPTVVLVSDGAPNEGPAPSAAVAERARAAGVVIYAVAVGGDAWLGDLLASITGTPDRVRLAGDAAALDRALRDLAALAAPR